MNTGTLFRARAIKNVFGGDAIARVAGKVVFLPGVLAGEEIVGKITGSKGDYARAEIVEITTPSPERIKPLCSGMGRCPGCVYGHCSHKFEQEAKLRQLREFMRPLGVDPEQIQGFMLEDAPAEFYRNKIRLTMRKAGGEAQLGYVFTDGRMYPLKNCALASRAINSKLDELFADPGFICSLHDRMTLTLRESADGVTIFRNTPGKNAPLLREVVLGQDFMVPADGFFQVNNYGMNALTNLMRDFLQQLDCQYFIDAYAGAGLFGFTAALAGVKKVVGVEAEVGSADAARQNYRNSGLQEFEFMQGDAGKLLPEILAAAPAGAAAVFDPPRGGMESTAIRALNNSHIKNIFYISCHPATLVRDLGRLQQGNFNIGAVRMIDMFPRSAHFETFVQLIRQ